MNFLTIAPAICLKVVIFEWEFCQRSRLPLKQHIKYSCLAVINNMCSTFVRCYGNFSVQNNNYASNISPPSVELRLIMNILLWIYLI